MVVDQTLTPSAPRIPRSPRVASALLAIASALLCLVGLAAAELLARRVSPEYLVARRGIHVFSPQYGWSGRPGAIAPMGRGKVSLNGRGYRGPVLSLPKPDDRHRVIVLGDSIAFGYGVADEDAFPHLLHVRANGLEVGNLAMEGYGPGQELLVLRHEGLEQDPDVVVLAFCLRNDFVDAVLPVALYDGVTPRPRFRLDGDRLALDDSAVPRSPARRAVQWLSDYSQLFNRLSGLVPRPERPEDPGWRVRKQEALEDEDYALRLTVALVKEMRASSEAQGARFLVVTFPSGLGQATPPPLHRRFHEALEAEGVWLVDMGEALRARDEAARETTIDRTGHLGPRGHALATEVLEQEISARLGAADSAPAL